MYLHKELETLTRPEIEKLQLERLQKTVRHCMNSPFYKQRFAENHLSPEDIRSLDDLQKIPFTTKQDLRDTYPFGLASVPLEKTVRLHSSSGTTGNPTVILHTQKDLDEWANAVARCLYMVGLRPGDIFQNSSGYGMFTGGLGFQYGAERLGMLTVPAAAGAAQGIQKSGEHRIRHLCHRQGQLLFFRRQRPEFPACVHHSLGTEHRIHQGQGVQKSSRPVRTVLLQNRPGQLPYPGKDRGSLLQRSQVLQSPPQPEVLPATAPTFSLSLSSYTGVISILTTPFLIEN